MRAEILQLEHRIKSLQKEKSNISEELEVVRRQIDRQARLREELIKKRSLTKQKLESSQSRLEKLRILVDKHNRELVGRESELDSVKDKVAQRMREMYKHRPSQNLFFLTSFAIPSTWEWQRRYLELIARRDALLVGELREAIGRVKVAKEELEWQNAHLASELELFERKLEEMKTLEQEINSENRRLKEQEDRYRQLLVRVDSDYELLSTLLQTQKRALKEIEQEIARAQERALPLQDKGEWVEGPFHQLKGRLPPPVERGRVVGKYGPQTHPRLGTVTINPGIDFQTLPGQSVRSVASGKVAKITWIRGFGNTIIINHGDYYYTVYGHIEEIGVSEGQLVKAGTVIGWTSSGWETAPLHFEIWQERETLDPLEWLRGVER